MDAPPLPKNHELQQLLAAGGMLAILVGGLIDIRTTLTRVEAKIEAIRDTQQSIKMQIDWRDQHPQPGK